MTKILKYASAFIGIIVGAGFASGQEILQYFTSFGHMGTVAAVVATALFAYLGMTLTRVGSRLQTESHREAIYTISGRILGKIVDYIIIFTLFGVGVVMVAGAGSILYQQFNFPPFVGSLIMTIILIVVSMLNVDKVIAVIGSVTPFLILALVIIGIYSLFTMDASFSQLNPVAKAVDTTLPNWFVSAVNYVSFNIAVGAGMSLVMGGTEKNERIAGLGGFLGGLGIGGLILIAHLAIFSKVDIVSQYEMPLLKIVDDISPVLGIFMTLVLFGMIFNTAISMFYAFVARFVEMETKQFNVTIIITCTIGFILSFVGFTNLVAQLYPLIGYLGLFLIFALIYAPFKLKKDKQ